MSNDPLIIDTELRKDPKTLQPKVIYAGDVWADQPYIAAQQSAINISASKPNGISITDKFGTTIGGPVSFSTMPDQISMGGGYWRMNPLLLSCVPSTTPTPVPMLVKSTPRLLAAKDDLASARNNIIANSDSPAPVASAPHSNATSGNASQPTTVTPATAITVTPPGINPPPPPTFRIGGSISGLAGSGLILQSNGGDNIIITANGSFTFPTQLPSGTVYVITILTPPASPAQSCIITNGNGIVSADITNIVVTCTTTELMETTSLASITSHNTSANAAYNKTNFPLSFTGVTWINKTGTTLAVNSNFTDDSLNPITPCHVSPVSIKTMIPGYTGKWFAHINPWFGSTSHASIGLNDNTTAWVQASMMDQQARGFDGIIIDWYGQGSREDSVTLLIKTQIATMVNFSYAIMIDAVYTTTAQLTTHLTYIKNTYFGTIGYQTHSGTPVVYYWGTPIAGVNYTLAATNAGVTIYAVMQGPGSLSNSYINACFDWVQPYGSGVPVGDPYNAAAANSYLSSVHSSSKGSMPCLAPGFNGYLTVLKESGYKQGYLLPRDYGKCWIKQAAVIAANLPTNIIGIQVATWCDWEEGSQIESAIDNGITVHASIVSNTLSWSVSGGTGDESTIAYYQLLATYDGVNVAVIGTTQNAIGPHTFNLNSITGWGTVSYTIYVVAVGIACVRNQISNGVPYTA